MGPRIWTFGMHSINDCNQCNYSQSWNSNSGVSRIWPASHIQPTAYFCKCFTGTQPHLVMLSKASFKLRGRGEQLHTQLKLRTINRFHVYSYFSQVLRFYFFSASRKHVCCWLTNTYKQGLNFQELNNSRNRGLSTNHKGWNDNDWDKWGGDLVRSTLEKESKIQSEFAIYVAGLNPGSSILPAWLLIHDTKWHSHRGAILDSSLSLICQVQSVIKFYYCHI